MNQETKISEYLEYWLINIVGSRIRISTFNIYKTYISNHLKPLIGDLRLCDISAKDIHSLITTYSKDLTNRTIRNILVMFSSSLDTAVNLGYLESNPMNKVKLPKIPEAVLKVFTRKEQRQIEEVVSSSKDSRSISILIGLYLGLRIGEISGLKWTDINFEDKSLKISNSLNRVKNSNPNKSLTSLVFSKPKTSSSERTIPIPPFLFNKLIEKSKTSSSIYVVSMKNNNYVEPREIQRVFKRILLKANVPYKSFHTLRHTFATRALEVGFDVKSIGEILGHKNISLTINLYCHSLMEQKIKMMENLEEFYNVNRIK